MKIIDFFKGKKRKELPDGRMSEHDEKIKKQEIQIDEQKMMLDQHTEQIEAIVAKTKGLAKEVQRINNERNTCISTFTRYEPEKVQDLESNVKIRSLNKESEYRYVASLVFRNGHGNISDEIILAQFNNGELKTIKEKLVQQLEFQQYITLGVLNEERMNFGFEDLKRYSENCSIEITEEGEKILTNKRNEPRNITKSIIYMGDENTTIDANILGNEDIFKFNYENYSLEEEEAMSKADKIVRDTISMNKITNIDLAIKQRKDEIIKFLEDNPDQKKKYEQILINKNKNNLINDAYTLFSKSDSEFEFSNEGQYLRIVKQHEKEAKDFYKENNLNVSKLMPTVSKGDTDIEIRKKLSIKRLLTYMHKENTEGISAKEEEIYNRFLLTVDTGEYGKSENKYINDEQIFLAGILDRIKTNNVNNYEENIQQYNSLLERQEYDGKIKYYIPPKESHEENMER